MIKVIKNILRGFKFLIPGTVILSPYITMLIGNMIHNQRVFRIGGVLLVLEVLWFVGWMDSQDDDRSEEDE